MAKAKKPAKRLEEKIYIGEGKNRKRISVYGKTTLELAENIKKKLAEAEEQQHPTFLVVAESWQEAHVEKLALGTQTCYAPALKRAKEEFGDKRLEDIEPMEIKQLLGVLAAQGKSRQTVHVQHVVLNLIFKYAIVEGYIKYNPAADVSLPRHLPNKKREAAEDSDTQKVIQSVNEPFGLFPFFLLFTGCRRGEALAVQIKDINFEKHIISIYKNVVYNGSQTVLNNFTKTKAGMREITIPETLLQVLTEKVKDRSPDEFLFSKNNPQKPMTPSEFRRAFEKYRKITGVTFTPHQLRHSYATILFDAGLSEKSAQQLMGHSDIEITHQIYTHIRTQRAIADKSKLDDFIGKMTG